MQSRELLLFDSLTSLTCSSTKEKSDKQHRSEMSIKSGVNCKGLCSFVFNFEILLLTEPRAEQTDRHPLKKPPFQNLTYAERLDRGAARLR